MGVRVTPQEAARVLAVACTLDARLTPPSTEDARARATLWAATLHPEMAPVWAEEAVVSHYRRSGDVIMPATLNEAYRGFRDRVRADEQARERARQAQRAVPMPADFRTRALGGGS